MLGKPLAIVIFTSFIFSSEASASTYDAASDFSATNNPNGVWSYGWSANLGSTFNLDTENGTTWSYLSRDYPGLGYWDRNSVSYPIVLHNSTLGPITVISSDGVGLTLQPGELAQHPGSDNSYSVLRWTAPNSGAFEVNSVFEGLDLHGVTTDVHVLFNGASIYDGYVNGYGDPTKQTFLVNLTLAAGDTIDFAVGPGGNGYIADTTATATSVTAVPIPSAVLLFGSGLACVIGFGKGLSRKP